MLQHLAAASTTSLVLLLLVFEFPKLLSMKTSIAKKFSWLIHNSPAFELGYWLAIVWLIGRGILEDDSF